METSLHALKEWAVICAALDRGLQTITLRKGGIEEEEGRFVARYSDFLLYPTLEHQKNQAIKAEQLSLFETAQVSTSPERRLVFHLWVHCHRVLAIRSEKTAEKLAAFTVWTAETLVKRFHLYPDKPLLLLILRAYHLNAPLILPEDPSYAGCRSWVPLVNATLDPSQIGPPVLSDSAFRQTTREVEAMVDLG
jgi:hypothetical protein